MSRHQVQHVPDGAERTFLGLTSSLKPFLSRCTRSCVYAAADGAEHMMRQSEGGGKRENYMHYIEIMRSEVFTSHRPNEKKRFN